MFVKRGAGGVAQRKGGKDRAANARAQRREFTSARCSPLSGDFHELQPGTFAFRMLSASVCFDSSYRS